jgi:ferredoxin-NADP reductase
MITVRIEAKTAVAQDICALTLVPADGSALPAFTAGAHVDVHLPAVSCASTRSATTPPRCIVM